MQIATNCTYCGEQTKVNHEIHRGSCLCKTCMNDDRLTYYRLRWRTLEEAESIENGFNTGTPEPMNPESFNGRVQKLQYKYDQPETAKVNETGQSLRGVLQSALTCTLMDALDGVDSYTEYNFKELEEVIDIILSTSTYEFLQESEADNKVDKYKSMLDLYHELRELDQSLELEVIDFILTTDKEFRAVLKKAFRGYRPNDMHLFGTDNLIDNLKIAYDLFNSLSDEETIYAITPLYLVRDSLRNPYEADVCLEVIDHLITKDVSESTYNTLKEIGPVVEAIADKSRELVYEIGNGPMELNREDFLKLKNMRDISCGLGGEEYTISLADIEDIIHKL